MPLTFDQPYPPHGRILAHLGEFMVGTIQPSTDPITWSVDMPGHRISGKAKTELAAKSALSHALHDWCLRAGLEIAR